MYKKEEILNLLENNDKAVLRAVIRIYENQTLEEKNNKSTIDENGIGFSSVDAYFLSCMALKIKKGIRLSKEEFAITKNKIKKYSKQLTNIANEEEAYRLKKLNYFKSYILKMINNFENNSINCINDYVSLIEDIKSLCNVKEG